MNLKELMSELENREYIVAQTKTGAEAPDVNQTDFSDGSVWFVIEDVNQE